MLSVTGKILKSQFLLSTPGEPKGKIKVSPLHFSISAPDEADRLTSLSGRFALEERTPRRFE
jgi:hypothetical protein